MRLRNKETWETGYLELEKGDDGKCAGLRVYINDFLYKRYDSLTKLLEEWEDVEGINVLSNVPLIKDEKIRKAVRAWAEANSILKHNYGCEDMDVVFDSAEHCFIWIDTSIQFNEITGLEELEDGGIYPIDELCGEEEE